MIPLCRSVIRKQLQQNMGSRIWNIASPIATPPARQKTPQSPARQNTPLPFIDASPASGLCNQRTLQPVPDHPFVPVLVVPGEPYQPFLCGTIETELEPDSLDNGVLHILLCIRSDNSIHHQSDISENPISCRYRYILTCQIYPLCLILP